MSRSWFNHTLIILASKVMRKSLYMTYSSDMTSLSPLTG